MGSSLLGVGAFFYYFHLLSYKIDRGQCMKFQNAILIGMKSYWGASRGLNCRAGYISLLDS